MKLNSPCCRDQGARLLHQFHPQGRPKDTRFHRNTHSSSVTSSWTSSGNCRPKRVRLSSPNASSTHPPTSSIAALTTIPITIGAAVPPARLLQPGGGPEAELGRGRSTFRSFSSVPLPNPACRFPVTGLSSDYPVRVSREDIQYRFGALYYACFVVIWLIGDWFGLRPQITTVNRS
jgi:hypothetical protein